MWVEVGGERFCDHSNGILRSGRFLHKATIPIKLLDKAKSYTLCLQRLNERKPYFTDYGEIERHTFTFRPVRSKSSYNIINLADAHCLVRAPIKSGSYFGDKLDLLILNGDIPNHSGDINYFKAIYQIAGGITKGQIPCIFSRGNHDMRGIYGEELENYTPTRNGKSYYTFRLGPIWGIVLDTGEDKKDTHAAYGCTICCSHFREEEEKFLDRVIKTGDYKKSPIRLIISHQPFARKSSLPDGASFPFDFEKERYQRWSRKLKKIKANLWLTGHLHECFFENKGDFHDAYGYPCPLLCSSKVEIDNEDGDIGSHTSGAVTIKKDGTLNVKFVSADNR